MADLIAQSSILVLASHASKVVERFCHRAIWLDAGKVREDGPVREVNQAYYASISKPQL